MALEEYNLPLTKDSYEHLIKKADGNIITKKRYEIPDGNGYTIELDIFEGAFNGTVIAEVEFNSIEESDNYIMPSFFTEDVTNLCYHELCIYFLMDISGTDLLNKGDKFTKAEGKHTHVFEWLEFSKLKDEYFYPLFLKKAIYDLPDEFTLRTELE